MHNYHAAGVCFEASFLRLTRLRQVLPSPYELRVPHPTPGHGKHGKRQRERKACGTAGEGIW
ncbi:hypothetical protein E2C01_034976 [Portunus trituberculatus]|uniref:Uncharacterized protein n=1 Tax=Portunus trituberculatus TaxID=210409 RepID=A0A5B7F7U3_PORTR|nr:hypothetical protein [Portunus trituberculatus]